MTRYQRFRFARLGAILVLGLLLTGCSADTAPIEEQPTTDTVTPFEPAVSYETFPLPQPILDGKPAWQKLSSIGARNGIFKTLS